MIASLYFLFLMSVSHPLTSGLLVYYSMASMLFILLEMMLIFSCFLSIVNARAINVGIFTRFQYIGLTFQVNICLPVGPR